MRTILCAAAMAVLMLCQLPAPAAASDPLVYAVQEVLTEGGYEPGPADGVMGPRTESAIRAFEEDHGLPVTGRITPDLFAAAGLSAYASEMAGGGGSGSESAVEPKNAPQQRQLTPLRLVPPVLSHNAAVDTDAGQGQTAEGKAQSQKAEDQKTGSQQAKASAIPPVADRFAPRNWLVRDFGEDGQASVKPFGIFLEEGGSVAGPPFARRLHWKADGVRFTMTYRNSIGQEIRRTGKLNGLNRMEGEAEGPDGRTWRWVAEAKPL